MNRKQIILFVVLLIIISTPLITTSYFLVMVDDYDSRIFSDDMARTGTSLEIVDSSSLADSVIMDSITQINATSINVDNGTLVNGSQSMLNDADETGMFFIEEKEVFNATQVATALETEDDADKWYVSGTFGSVISNNTAPYEGVHCLDCIVSSSGFASLFFDNDTTNAWNFDATNANKLNFSLKTDSPSLAVLTDVRTYYNATAYSYTNPYVYLTSSWQVLSVSVESMNLAGGVQIGDPINWIEFRFWFGAASVGQSVYFDSGGLYGPIIGDAVRSLHGYVEFENIPDYDCYVLNISARQYVNTSYCDEFFSDDINDWSSTGDVVLTNDAANAQTGTNAMKFAYAGTSNVTVIFDNGTTKNMKADFSNHTAHSVSTWTDGTFTLEYARWYTNTTNYYYIGLDYEYTSTITPQLVPFSYYSEYGSPSWSNISWVEFSINNIDNPNALTIWNDHFHMTTAETIRFSSPLLTDVYLSSHVHGTSSWDSGELEITHAVLDSHNYAITLLFNDTALGNDVFNTSIQIDYVYITAWNVRAVGGLPTSTTVTTEDGNDFILGMTDLDYLVIGVISVGLLGSMYYIKVGSFPKLQINPLTGLFKQGRRIYRRQSRQYKKMFSSRTVNRIGRKLNRKVSKIKLPKIRTRKLKVRTKNVKKSIFKGFKKVKRRRW